MLTLVIEFSRQRRKFNLQDNIDINLLEDYIKRSFSIENEHLNDYIIQIFDEEINDFIDLTSDSLNLINKPLIKGQIISRHIESFHYQPKVAKEQIVGLITLESIEKSLEKWSKLIQNIQLEICKELETVKETIIAVKSHYKIIDEINSEDNLSVNEMKINSTSTLTSTVDPYVNKNTNNQKFQTINNHRRGISHKSYSLNRENHNNYYPPSNIPLKPIEYNVPISVTYQRFQAGVDFQGELSKFYNPTYFFLRISNQIESYDEMHQQINSYYNNIELNQNQNYFLQSGEFCVAKSPSDSNWYRARIIRLIRNEEAQLIFIDNGQIKEINVNLIHPLNHEFSVRPAQALVCSLAQILPLTQNDKCGWNRRSCMSLENAMKNERLSKGKFLLNVTTADNNQVKWPMMFVNISTETNPNLSEYMCDLYLSRRCSNFEISQFWSNKIRPEQYVLFNLSSLINQKQYFINNNNNNSQSKLTIDQTIDIIMNDLEFSRQ